jgi:multidrug efflux pump subunit AcrA (membrane-fusion protein)
MMKFWNSRVRAVAAGGTALVVIAGIGLAVANSSQAATARYVTTTVGTGDVVQTYTATGTISRDNTQAAAFTVDGTVKSVAVAVGDTVDAGDDLATLKTGPLKLAVLNAETAVAQAKASLYAAQNPASTSSGSGAASGGGSGSGTGSGGTTITIDPVMLTEAVSRINLAVLSEAEKCEPVFGSILPAPEATATATPTSTASPTTSATGSATASPSATASATPSATPTPTATPTATATATPTTTSTSTPEAITEPTASASQLEAIEANDPTKAELQDCANARAEVLAANANLQAVVTLLTTPRPTTPTTPVKKSSSSSSSSSSNARAVASAKADLLKAEQDLQAADDVLDAATLVAPISGTVGVVGLSAGDSASSGTITIIGSGNAVVTFELPLKTRSLVTTGQEVTVTPAGSTTGMTGKLTSISSLETSGTSGSTPTYATTVAVSDPEQLLASGAKASVAIAVKSVTGVVRLPASAVTPTGTGTATVAVVASATADTTTSVEVKTGAVGGGWVEITEGIEAGKLVVLADRTADIPTNANRRRTTTTSTSSSSASSAPSASAQPSGAATTQASAQPTATATR